MISLIGHDNWVRGLALHHTGKFLYSVSDDKSMRIWDLKNGKCVQRFIDTHNQFVTCIASNYKYFTVATASVDNNIKIWECK